MKKYLIHIAVFLLMLTPASHAAYIDTDAEVAVVIDGHTGKVLFSKDKDKKTYPASMTKIMTTLIIFEKLANETLSLDDKFLVSEKAWREREGSSMFVEVDKEIRVEDLLRGIIVQSGNDACIVVAENIAGTEESFAKMMTQKAKEIGMKNTNFTNSTGMYDKDNYSTVYDIALLSMHLINEYPQYYHLFAETEFEWSGIKQNNRNSLLYKNMGVDGLKTGHLSKSGYGLAASAVDQNRRVISVVNGFESTQKRTQGSSRLITWAFREFTNLKLFEKEDIVGQVEISGASSKESDVSTGEEIIITVPKSKRDGLTTNIVVDDNISAPLNAGDKVGYLEISVPGEENQTYELYATNEIDRSNIFVRFFNYLINLILSLFN
ncbi:MAG: D-alanyl-D-alanine carboxypeptidase [Pelagibacteraceae bacterium]|nr:D-alanyl-D-alanine carboxypeptidase [Pelagibacteraceae bacterium]|tara:strand:- start:1379 stop:2515 length:1137 start_codon:yes stop_codon:yes gene_type:complete